MADTLMSPREGTVMAGMVNMGRQEVVVQVTVSDDTR